MSERVRARERELVDIDKTYVQKIDIQILTNAFTPKHTSIFTSSLALALCMYVIRVSVYIYIASQLRPIRMYVHERMVMCLSLYIQ